MVRLLHEFQHPSIMPRHWDKLCEVTGKTLVPPQLKIQDFFDAKIWEYQDAVLNIAKEAVAAAVELTKELNQQVALKLGGFARLVTEPGFNGEINEETGDEVPTNPSWKDALVV